MEQRSVLSERLTEIVLESQKVDKMPSSIAKAIVRYHSENTMTSDAALTALLHGAKAMEAERTMDLLKRLELTHLAEQGARSI